MVYLDFYLCHAFHKHCRVGTNFIYLCSAFYKHFSIEGMKTKVNGVIKGV